MHFQIVTNLTNGVGLQRDYELLRGLIEAEGHTVSGVKFTEPRTAQPADVNLFLETVVPEVVPLAPRNWAVPNPEWWTEVYTSCLPNLDLILCKTHDTYRLFNALGKAVYLGFESRDFYDPSVERVPRFLHVAGNSGVKNSEAVLDAWSKVSYPLTLVTRLQNLESRASRLPNITCHMRISDAALADLLNSHRYHILPSEYEGWGHALHEALGVGATVITTDAPPMHEWGIPADLLITPATHYQLRLARMNKVTAESIVDMVNYAAGLPTERLDAIGADARASFLYDRENFRTTLRQVLTTVC